MRRCGTAHYFNPSTMRLIKFLFLLVLPLLVLACGVESGPSDSKSAGLVAPPASAAVNYSVSNASGPDGLARMAVNHHPSIAAARHKVERLAAKVPQEGALPDPSADMSVGTMTGTADDRMIVSGGVRQEIPFPGKRREQAAAAAIEAEAAAAEVEALELKLTEQVHAAWWDLYLAQQTIEITGESRSILEAVRDSVDARVSANQAGQSDQLRLGNELSLIDRDLVDAEQLRNTARARLNSLLNRPAGAALPVARKTAIPQVGSLESLLARAQVRHPEVAAAQKRSLAYQHRLKRAELERYPDFTAGVGGARDQAIATVGVKIPLWQEPRRAMIREAKEGIAETEALVADARSDLRYQVEDAWFRAQTAREISALFETRLLPDSQQAYEVTLTGYSAGTEDFTGLLETWRQTLSYRLQLARNQAQLGKATATLKAAAGIK